MSIDLNDAGRTILEPAVAFSVAYLGYSFPEQRKQKCTISDGIHALTLSETKMVPAIVPESTAPLG